MADTLDEDRLQAIEARAQAATEGLVTHKDGCAQVWTADWPVALCDTADLDGTGSDGPTKEQANKNADFFAAARTDVPALVAALRASWERTAKLLEAMRWAWPHIGDEQERSWPDDPRLCSDGTRQCKSCERDAEARRPRGICDRCGGPAKRGSSLCVTCYRGRGSRQGRLNRAIASAKREGR